MEFVPGKDFSKKNLIQRLSKMGINFNPNLMDNKQYLIDKYDEAIKDENNRNKIKEELEFDKNLRVNNFRKKMNNNNININNIQNDNFNQKIQKELNEIQMNLKNQQPPNYNNNRNNNNNKDDYVYDIERIYQEQLIKKKKLDEEKKRNKSLFNMRKPRNTFSYLENIMEEPNESEGSNSKKLSIEKKNFYNNNNKQLNLNLSPIDKKEDSIISDMSFVKK